MDFFVFPAGVFRMVSGSLEQLCPEVARGLAAELLLVRTGLRANRSELSSPVCYANEFPGYWDGEAEGGAKAVKNGDSAAAATKRDRV